MAKKTRSSVAGIIDPYGGLRVVVAEPHTFTHHIRPDELLFIVPGLKVREPVSWRFIPTMIARVERHIDWWIRTRNDPDILNLEAIKMYRLRQLQHPQSRHSLHLPEIVET